MSNHQWDLSASHCVVYPVGERWTEHRVEHSWSEIRSEMLMLLRQLVLNDIRAPIIGPFRAWKPPIPYAIKNQRGASKISPMGVFCVPKPLVGGFGCDELVLYGIRELASATLWFSRPMRAKPRHSSTNESGPGCVGDSLCKDYIRAANTTMYWSARPALENL